MQTALATIEVVGDVAYVSLGRSELRAIIDARDVDIVAPFRWYEKITSGVAYARAQGGWLPPKVEVMMHRMILGPTRERVCDHVNGDGLDNRRANLRLATAGENNLNRHRIYGRSQYLGVSPAQGGKWRAYLSKDGRQVHIGTFATEEEAARARDERAAAELGRFASLNFA